MAIACLRFLCSPFFKWRISVSTIFCALGPYLRPELFLRGEEDLPREELPLRDEDDLFELDLGAIAILPWAAVAKPPLCQPVSLIGRVRARDGLRVKRRVARVSGVSAYASADLAPPYISFFIGGEGPSIYC